MTKKLFLLILGLSLFFSCNNYENTNSPIVYYNGDIITMVGDTPNYVEAIVEKQGKIVFTGSSEEAMKIAGKGHKMINLDGNTLVPGLIDGHAHFANFGAQAIGAQLLASPDANVNDIETLISVLKTWNTSENRALTGWIFGTGFDDSILIEKRFPTKHDLDKVSTEFPIIITHISGHFAVVNSKGLEKLGIDKNSKDPEGGLIRRENKSTEPNGVLEELAAIPYILQAIAPKSEEALVRFFEAGQEMALSYGYTTAQEGRAMQNHEMLVAMAEKDKYKIDVISYIDYAFVDKYMDSKWNSRTYTNRYRIGGMKVTLDGSPQGRTAWRTEPYLLSPDGMPHNYSGYPAIPNDSVLTSIFEKGFENNWQILSHTNGDAAIDQFIRTLKPLQEKYGKDHRRDVIIHGQYIREDQLDEAKEMNMIASLFPLHTFYWGDWHKELIGDSLVQNISPVKTALNKGMKITIHTDAPVALPNLMRVLWTAVERTSRSGGVIGPDERLTPYEALQAITIWSAYQHYEEDKKGSLEIGKLADFVILDKNPLTVEPKNIKDIQVLKTIKEGKIVFEK
ncbi:amidohydrolase [Ichthyenterobacterium sp. W332]|uniref:Amidohydrolase n=1 Tax=Microcosmobacter mediterraneus TaxID=3075607 RepID=A0ABU2YGW8_9FLAO|nr:amidohydrolase [Ichthyenterobacterium sp. W332]MDT0557423.1 amidohydrolase [Ichthyenterobacterium sp. W332]